MSDEQLDDDALFGVAELRLDRRAGRAEQALHAALKAGATDQTLLPVDAALAAAALIAARALDDADTMRDRKAAGYLIAQSLGGYREALHALRLPAAPPSGGVPLPAPGGAGTGGWSDELRGIFGGAE